MKPKNHQPAQGALSVPEALERPLAFQQFETQFPEGMSGTVAEPALQITEASAPKPDYGQDLLGCYIANPPIHEGSVYVAYLAKLIYDAFVNYERKHLHRVVENYPMLKSLLLDEGTYTTGLEISDEAYATRLANLLYQYDTWSAKYMGAVFNIATMMRLTPGAENNYIGYAFRASVVNPRMNVFKVFTYKTGLREYFFSHYKWVLGKEINGAPIVVFPLFNTSVLGVRGVNCITPSSLRAASNPKSTVDPMVDDGIADLLENAGDVIRKFDHGLEVQYRFTMPFIENGNQIVMQKGGKSFSYQMNIPNDVGKLHDAQRPTNDNVVGHLWTAFTELQEYGTNFFAEFMDRNSVIMRLFGPSGELMQLYTDECNFEEIYNFTRSDHSWDYNSFMEYVSAHSHGTYPPSVVHWSPIIPHEDDRTKYNKTIQLTRYNPFYYRSPRLYLKDTEKWPRLGATMKTGIGDTKETFFVNTIAGQYTDLDGTSSLFGPTGGALSFSVNQNLDLDASTSIVHGLSLEDAKRLVLGYGEELFMFNEAQDSPMRLTAPFIDTADPYQCGINLFLTKDLKYMSKYVEQLQDPKQWNEIDRAATDNQPIPTDDLFTVDVDVGGVNVILDQTDLDYVEVDGAMIPAHWSNSAYRSFIGSTLVFIGANAAPGLIRSQFQAGAGFGIDDFTADSSPKKVMQQLFAELKDTDLDPDYAESFWYTGSRTIQNGIFRGNAGFPVIGAFVSQENPDVPISALLEITLPPTYGFICLPGHVNPLSQWNDVRAVCKLGTEWSLQYLQDNYEAFARKGYRVIARKISDHPLAYAEKYATGFIAMAKQDRAFYQSLNRYNPYLSEFSLPSLDTNEWASYPVGKALVNDLRASLDVALNLLAKVKLVFMGFGKRFGFFWSDISFKPSDVNINDATWDPAIRVAITPRDNVKYKPARKYAFNPDRKSSRQYYKPELLKSIESTMNLGGSTNNGKQESQEAGSKSTTEPAADCGGSPISSKFGSRGKRNTNESNQKNASLVSPDDTQLVGDKSPTVTR